MCIRDSTDTAGSIRFVYTPRHSAVDAVKFVEAEGSVAYIAEFYADADDYIRLYWSAANTLTLAYSMAGTSASGNYNAGSITAGVSYDLAINYTGSGSMILEIDETPAITLNPIPEAFGTTPTLAYWGSSQAGDQQGDATFDAWLGTTTQDASWFVFDSSSGGNHEIENIALDISEIGTVAVAEDTDYHVYSITLETTGSTFGIDGTTASLTERIVTSRPYVYLQTTDDTNTLALDYVFVRKLATGTPTVSVVASEELSPGPVAWWKLDEGYGPTTYDHSGQGQDGTITGASWRSEEFCAWGKCLYFDGSGDSVAGGNLGIQVRAVSFWVRPNLATGYFVDLDNGTHYISSAGGQISATGFADPAIYINGVETTTLPTNRWSHVVVSTGTGITASNVRLGQVGVNSLQGFMDEVVLYQTELSAEQLARSVNSRTAEGEVVFGAGDQKALSDGLVGYWKMDEASGNATDSSGVGTTLTNNESVGFVGGKYGNSADLIASSSQFFSAADNPALSVTGDLTISAWINPDSVTAATQFVIAGKWEGELESYLLAQYGDEIRLYLNDPANYVTTDSANLTTGNWYQITAVYESAKSSAEIYINGARQSVTVSGTLPSSIPDTASQFAIGAENTSDVAENFYDGQIDEVRVYNRALAEEHVSRLYQWAPGPVGHWKFDEGSGDTAYDTTVNANHGSLFNNPVWTRLGRLGRALDFDGSDDHIVGNDYYELHLSLIHI